MQNEPITEQERANNKIEQELSVDELLKNREKRRKLEITAAKRVRIPVAIHQQCGKPFIGPIAVRCQCPPARPRHLANMETK